MNNLSAFDHDGVLVVDSRLIAERLNIEHESLMRSLKKYQERIERRFGVIRFEIGKPLKGSKGGRPTEYALLNEPQATVLMTLSRNTDEVIECKLDLTEAFETAKELLRSQQTPSPTGEPYWYRRLKLYREKTKIPVGYFSVFEEITGMVGDLETNGYILKDGLIPDVSVGLCWASYLRKSGVSVSSVAKKYKHYYPDWAHSIEANIYPVDLLPKFKVWLEETYKPQKMYAYFRGKDPDSLPSVCKLLGLPEGQK